MLQSLLDAIGFGLCHQLPERSFFGGGVRVPVCSRDVGIYAGFAVAFLVLALVHRDRPRKVPPTWVSAILAFGVALMAADGISSYAGLRYTTNEIRLMTGLMTGFALAAWVMPLVNSELWRAPGQGRVLGRPRDVVLYLATLCASYAGIWYVAPLLGVAYPIGVVGAIIVTLVAVNLVIVSLLPSFGGRSATLVDAWPALLLALALSGAQLAASSLLKAWLIGLTAA
ncbi:MAG TPA: DUF2085 domain-containing protein [Coriobacteriia bacterium]|nr:DUF2085 domain-containing protein [Coriobacteriia bacterium]